jgi:hypothetical protein
VAFESGRAVELEYEAAGGTILEHVTVEQVDAARFLGEVERTRSIAGPRIHGTSCHGSTTSIPVPSKSLTLRVARVAA